MTPGEVPDSIGWVSPSATRSFALGVGHPTPEILNRCRSVGFKDLPFSRRSGFEVWTLR